MPLWPLALCLVALTAVPAIAEPSEFVPSPDVSPTRQVDGSSIVENNVADHEAERHVWLGAEYLYWWLREGRLPATLTTSAAASQGLLGRPDTQVLYGDDRLETRHQDRFIGIRVNLGFWFDDEHSLGLEGGGFFLERDSTYFKAISDGRTLLARPFFNPDGSPGGEIIAGSGPEGLRNGGFVGYSRIELFGEEANLIGSVCCGDCFRFDALGGARFLQMRDRTDLTATGRLLPDQTTLFGLTDHYRVHNAYYGGQVGLRGEYDWGRWFMSLKGEVGLGANQEQVGTFGDRTYQTPEVKIVKPAGLTVQPNGTGIFDRTAVNMVSEVAFNVGCRLTSHAQVFAGYTFLLWDSPIRSGDQVARVVNTDPNAPVARPVFKQDLFWAQGANVGLAFGW
jgi:hypothetical protein